MTTIITTAMIDTAAKRGACREALDWLRASPRTVDELIAEQPMYAGWALRIPPFTKLLTDAQVEAIVRAAPDYGIMHARARISPSLFDELVKQDPWRALVYAAEELTPQQLAYCVEACPGTAYRSARHFLTREQIEYCHGHP